MNRFLDWASLVGIWVGGVMIGWALADLVGPKRFTAAEVRAAAEWVAAGEPEPCADCD